LEQGVFSRPSEAVLHYLSEAADIPEAQLIREYYQYQRNTRRAFRDRFPDYSKTKELSTAVADLSLHPLTRYYTTHGLSRIGVCKGWCVHPFSFEQYEKNKQRSVPDDIQAAWFMMGWDLRELRADVDRWRRDYR
jgi:hypothetical protein